MWEKYYEIVARFKSSPIDGWTMDGLDMMSVVWHAMILVVTALALSA